MSLHRFTLFVDNELSENIVEKIYDSGFKDSTCGFDGYSWYIHMDRRSKKGIYRVINRAIEKLEAIGINVNTVVYGEI